MHKVAQLESVVDQLPWLEHKEAFLVVLLPALSAGDNLRDAGKRNSVQVEDAVLKLSSRATIEADLCLGKDVTRLLTAADVPDCMRGKPLCINTTVPPFPQN